jgi:hypothetical protein
MPIRFPLRGCADSGPHNTVAPGVKPRWDDAGYLWLGAVVVKRVRPDAVLQRQVLRQFQLQGWRDEVDDPLPIRGCRDPKARVRETVRALNRGQHGPVRVVFHATQALLGYRWELVHT